MGHGIYVLFFQWIDSFYDATIGALGDLTCSRFEGHHERDGGAVLPLPFSVLAGVAELADAADSKSESLPGNCGFESRRPHHFYLGLQATEKSRQILACKA